MNSSVKMNAEKIADALRELDRMAGESRKLMERTESLAGALYNVQVMVAHLVEEESGNE